MSSQQDPQACTKCGCMPQDILMLACSHDLCLNCASDRLAFQLKKNAYTNAITCQECHQKTPLDTQSINVLKSMIKPTKSTINQQPTTQNQSRPYEQSTYTQPVSASNKYQEQSKYDRTRQQYRPNDKYSYSKDNSMTSNTNPNNYQRSSTDRNNITNNSNSNTNNKSRVSVDAFQGISAKKTCTEHHDEEILYFCFDCKCECICPQCVIHGKHKDHDVKTIRKSQPIVKAEIDKYLEKYDHNVETLIIKKGEIQKQIRSISQQNNMSKKQIQQAFDDLRNKIAQQEREILSRCDQNLNDNLGQLQKTSKTINRKIQQLKGYSANMSEAARKDQILFLNYYSKKYRELQQESKEPEIPSAQLQTVSNESVISSVLDAGDQVTRIGFGSTPKASRKT